MNPALLLPATRTEDLAPEQIRVLMSKAQDRGFPQEYLVRLTIQQIEALSRGKTDA